MGLIWDVIIILKGDVMEIMDFVQVESKVPGITVFAPRPKQKEEQQAKSGLPVRMK